MRWRRLPTPAPPDLGEGVPKWVGLGCPPGTRFFQVPRIDCVEPDSHRPRRLFHELAAEVGTIPGHHRACGQSKAQRIRLILEIQHDLSRHRTSPDKGRLAGSEWSVCAEGARSSDLLDACLDFPGSCPPLIVFSLV